MFNRPKKLKRISYDTVAYIQIETEAIRDYNDKQMISSYCISKLEMVNYDPLYFLKGGYLGSVRGIDYRNCVKDC